MKKLSIFLIFVAALLNYSCNDWFDVSSSTEMDRKDLFKNEQGYAEALAGVYSKMCDPSLYGRELSFGLLSVLQGDYTSCYGPDYDYNNIVYNPRCYKHDTQGSYQAATLVTKIDAVWSTIYNQVANLNSILESIDADKNLFEEGNYEVIKGETLGLRAFLLLDILRMFGPAYMVDKDRLAIPYVRELSLQVSPLVSVDDALTLIVKDLDSAVELLQNDPIKTGTTPNTVLASAPTGNSQSTYNIYSWHNRRFHFNYYAAKATLARAYLWKGDSTNALKNALECIDAQATRFPWVKSNALAAISSNGTYSDRTFATEQIFALNNRMLEANQDGYLLILDGSSYPGFALFSADRSLYENSEYDVRLKYLFTAGTYGTLLSKYYQRSGYVAYFKDRQPLIRISEMYYIAAECTGDVATAAGYIDAVRANRGLTTDPLVARVTTRDDLEQELEKEYRKEFFGEGQTWFYYKRHQATSLPNIYNFSEAYLDCYDFDRPEEEDLYGGR